MERILGQDDAGGRLLDAIAHQRVHHAWVFGGPRGVGKFTTAIEFAKLLLDPSAGPDLLGRWSVDPEGPVARQVDAGSHPDLHVIRKELALVSSNPTLRSRKLTTIPLDVLREFMIGGTSSDDRTHEPIVFHTAKLGHGKVFIVDEAELLDVTSQNALLKTLEEPPARTYVILVTSRPAKLLPTIRSRCQWVSFRRLEPEAMATWMDDALPDVGDDARPWLVDFAEGSPGIAQLAAQAGFQQWEIRLRPLLSQLRRGTFAPELGEAMASLVDEFAQQWVKEHDNASKDAANKDGAGHLLALLGSIARRELAATIEGGGDPEPVLGMIDALHTCEAQLAANVNLKQALEGVAASWCLQPA